MQSRPIIKLTPSRLDKTIELVSKILLLLICIFSVYLFIQSPAIIPIHYNTSGHINDYGSKWTLFILPAVAVFVYFLITTLNKRPHIFNYIKTITADNAAQQYLAATRMLRILKLVILIIICSLIVFDYVTIIGVVKSV